jgi:N4-gp56 family major capsid protein
MDPVSLSALKGTGTVETYANFVNSQIANGTARVNPETFYSKVLLDTIRDGADSYPYFKYAESQMIPDKSDKLQLRRWSALQGHTSKLLEGTPPMSDKGSVIKYELQAYQYGRYMEFTDKVDFAIVDPVIRHFAAEYAIVAVETLDLLAREALMLNAQEYYADGALSPDGFTFSKGEPSMTDLRKIVLSMQKAKVKPRSNGRFHVIASPEFFYDMVSDATVEKYMTINNTTKNMYEGGMLVPMFGLEFYESINVPTSGEYYDATGALRLKIYNTSTLAVGNSTGATSGLVDLTADALTTAAGYHKDFMTNMDASYNPALKTWTIPDGNYAEFKMQHVFVLGANALTRTGLSGQDSAKMFTKGLGSSGVMDPIDQRQSIGFKINSVGFGSTRPEAIVDYVCVPSLLNNASIYEGEQGPYISGDPAAASVQTTPTFSPAAGARADNSEITITSANATKIFYTTDGSTPTIDSDLYDADAKPVLTDACTFKAMAYRPGYALSAIGSAAYTISG